MLRPRLADKEGVELTRFQTPTSLWAVVARLEARIVELEGKLALAEFKLATTEAKLARTEAKLVATEAKLVATEAKLAATEAELAKARKNSSNSSKPPSSDIVKPPQAPRNGRRRRPGGQAGHPQHERPPFAPKDVDQTETHALSSCPGCGGALVPSDDPATSVQQVELATKLVHITEHCGLAYQCRHCRVTHWAPMPPEVDRGGLLGPRLTALVAYLKGACHASFSTIRKFFRDVLGFRVSRGLLAKVIGKVSASLEDAYQELLARLASEPHLNVDETGHPENGKGLWTWCFRAELYTVFKIDPSRGSKVLVEVLGKAFNGVLGCDYFSAYHKYMGDFGVEVQFCLAHLIRDVKFLTTHPDPATRRYGVKVLGGLRRLFRVIHRREQLGPAEFQHALQCARDHLIHLVLSYVPERLEARNLAQRFREHAEAYFRFITIPGVPPTNNLAEQAIRFVVIDRLVTQGTRSPAGRRWCERIWTVLATCEGQGRSAFEYLLSSVTHFFTGLPYPSLLPSGP